MHPVSLIFGAACIGAYAGAVRSGSGATQFMALLFGIVWAAANQLAVIGGAHLLPFVDLPTAIAAYGLWFERRERWQAWLAVLFGARLPLHLFAAWGGVEWVSYIHTINALFLASLLAVAWTGGIDELVSTIRLHVVRRLRARVAPRAGLAAEASR